MTQFSIVKAARPDIDPRELYITAMFAMYMRAPARPTREEVKRGVVTDLGEIGEVPDKTWERSNCYATATPKL